MTCIVDYGAGNLRSVQNAFERIGANCCVTGDPVAVRQSERIILPGVGHFGQMMSALDRLGLRDVLSERLRAGVPFLGVCLGLQALFDESEEAPGVRGLGFFRGKINRFGEGLRIPHMGWNEVCVDSRSRLLPQSERHYFYFAHSFFALPNDHTTGRCEYGMKFSAVVEAENVFAAQFHPEKSGDAGLEFLRCFLRLTESAC